jgi:hypothetical protein
MIFLEVFKVSSDGTSANYGNNSRSTGTYSIEGEEKVWTAQFDETGSVAVDAEANGVLNPVYTFSGGTSIDRCRFKVGDISNLTENEIFEAVELETGDKSMTLDTADQVYVQGSATYDVEIRSFLSILQN